MLSTNPPRATTRKRRLSVALGLWAFLNCGRVVLRRALARLEKRSWVTMAEPLSMDGTRGASETDLSGYSAHCIAHIASGRMYASDRKYPSVVHASGVWNQYLRSWLQK